MKTITKEIRKAILLENIGSEIVRFKTEGGILNISNLAYIENFDLWEQISLIKTPLQEIKDEDSIELYKILGWNDEKEGRRSPKTRFEFYGALTFDGAENWDFHTSIKMYNYLRSKQYALPFMNYTVEELFELKIYQKK